MTVNYYDFLLSSCHVMASFFFKIISTLVSFFLNDADSMHSLRGEMVNPWSLPSLVILKSTEFSVVTLLTSIKRLGNMK